MIITISREVGSGGRELGKISINFPFFLSGNERRIRRTIMEPSRTLVVREVSGQSPIRTNFRRIDKAAVWEFYVFQ